MCVRASVVLMQCTLAHHVKFVRASSVNFHTLPNSNQGQIRSNLISHVFILNTNFNGHQFLVAKSALNGRNATVFALRFCGPPSWMRERVRSRIKSRPSDMSRSQSGVPGHIWAFGLLHGLYQRESIHNAGIKEVSAHLSAPTPRDLVGSWNKTNHWLCACTCGDAIAGVKSPAGWCSQKWRLQLQLFASSEFQG